MTIDYEIIGKRIKEERLKNKLKQEEIADKIGISTAFYSRIENGKAKINLKRLFEISEILGKSVGYFIDNSVQTSKMYLNYEFNELFDKCNTNQKKFIYNITELIAKK